MEADWAMIGRGDLGLHARHSNFRLIANVWRSMMDRQRQRAHYNCFRLLPAVDNVTSTDGSLTVNHHPAAGKKVNQRKRPRASAR